ncbi:hypothetical protein BJV82DRAFT_526184 [Fennellomyces sp. T-0311]|nr:hypothetical protein BJV82DRAFT_526184 [Fennellomyces sp. T-0311]
MKPPQGVALAAAAAAANPSPTPTSFPQLSTRPPVVPAATPAAPPPQIETIPADSEGHRRNLLQYQARDERYQETLNMQHKRHMAIAHEKKREIEAMHIERRSRARAGPAAVFGPGYSGCGNAPTGLDTRIMYPLSEQGKKEDTLVPIRLEIEIDGYKLRDTFTWNMNETLITPEQFAEIMCEDLQLPTAQFAQQIARGIKDQVQDYYLHSGSTRKSAELRMLMKLDITVGNRALLDQFEWDIANPRNNAEEFAERLANELGLGGEFRTAIAHSIREQAHNCLKSLILVGYEFNGSQILDDDLRQSFLPTLRSTIRDNDSVERFTPAIVELTDAEIDKLEKDRMRDARRKRRQARGRRGIILPDREAQKTYRTGIAVPPEQELSDEQFLMNVGMVNGAGGSNTRGSTPTYEPMHSQRKSAMKARMNIAADAASNHHMAPSSPAGLQGTIPLSAGNRFSSMVDHSRPSK